MAVDQAANELQVLATIIGCIQQLDLEQFVQPLQGGQSTKVLLQQRIAKG